ncbi:uncharacterized protein PITG_14187 [Phytophthora infestans T30-4]|uniref:DDE-1 domain-containing protein n=1 Tax=Phytophthora infestans (strain T30-4) TaxID=403677 RepID=D0NNU1_PHYIT|nr:uncharacterized protein PITG_14187 [Phytophthora infestans T30-4]EEY62262.1 conserved hypothetical protein [Phytophthora infestans T30-4]|eukprot:XP_002899293.1 conserved hypothetical protein [Phytophthora infestans T30-4]
MGRDDFPLKTSHVLLFVKEEYPDFLNDSLARNKEESLGRLIRWLIYQQGFSFRRPTKSILSTVDLEAEQRAFASQVGTKVNATYARSCIFNADETAVYYDAKPTRIISERGAKKSLRPVIIFKGKPGGRVEEEVRGISSRVVTAVQRNAWMDSRLWLETFVEDSWGCFMSSTHPGPMALYVDNLQCHLVPLPKNTTSVLQPLDVGVMGPFKQKLRAITLVFELGAVAPSGHLPLRERLLAIERMSALEKRKRLVERVIAAWDAVSEDTIKKAWLKAGL